MNHSELIELIRQPEKVKPEFIADLKALVEDYPYFTLARLLYLRALQQDENIAFNTQLDESVLHVADREWLFYYLYPEKKAALSSSKLSGSLQKTGSYFDLLDLASQEGENVETSLKVLAERLRQARLYSLSMEGGVEPSSVEHPRSDLRVQASKPELEEGEEQEYTLENYQEKIKALLQKREYQKALVNLEKLYLNNPEKNAYFADQIRFVKKIIANSKK